GPAGGSAYEWRDAHGLQRGGSDDGSSPHLASGDRLDPGRDERLPLSRDRHREPGADRRRQDHREGKGCRPGLLARRAVAGGGRRDAHPRWRRLVRPGAGEIVALTAIARGPRPPRADPLPEERPTTTDL